jgi:hypothetical protein
MDDLVKEVIPLLQYLIPGFLSAWIFYSLTAFKRPDTFGQIVQALIFTFVIQGAVWGVGTLCLWVGSKGFSVGRWDAKAETMWAFVVSVTLGLLSCYLATNDKLHGWLRSRNVTKQTSYPQRMVQHFCSAPSSGHTAFERRKARVWLARGVAAGIQQWPVRDAESLLAGCRRGRSAFWR